MSFRTLRCGGFDPHAKHVAIILSLSISSLFFRSKFELNILEQPNENDLVFEIKGVDVSFANALRRIMIAEVPSVAIEKVYIFDNTSIIHDEVLAHRLGLVPINVDPRLLTEVEDEDALTDENTLVFRLKVSCGRSRADEERRERARKAMEERRDQGSNAVSDDSVLETMILTRLPPRRPRRSTRSNIRPGERRLQMRSRLLAGRTPNMFTASRWSSFHREHRKNSFRKELRWSTTIFFWRSSGQGRPSSWRHMRAEA